MEQRKRQAGDTTPRWQNALAKAETSRPDWLFSISSAVFVKLGACLCDKGRVSCGAHDVRFVMVLLVT